MWENLVTKEQYENFRKQFIEELFPNFLIALTVSPLTAIKRRGGAGHLVNNVYIKKYNEFFMRYYNELKCNKVIIETEKLDIYQMNDIIYKVILKNLP